MRVYERLRRYHAKLAAWRLPDEPIPITPAEVDELAAWIAETNPVHLPIFLGTGSTAAADWIARRILRGEGRVFGHPLEVLI